MEAEEVKVFEKQARICSIDVHPTEKSLVISYELEAVLVDQLGDRMLEETKEMKKKINVKGLSEETDIKALASEIIEKSNIIPPSRQNEIEQLLYYLHTRKSNMKRENFGRMDQFDHGQLRSPRSNDLIKSPEDFGVASISALDDYIELLYEGIPEKIKSSALVLQLARKPDNLTVLAKNDILIGALARVLREDGRKSIELSTNIVYAFFCFSAFQQFHPIIVQYKVGSLCMELVDTEVKRYEQWTEEITKKKDLIEQDKTNGSSAADFERSYQKYLSIVKKQDQLLSVCFYLLYNISDETKIQMKMANRGIVSFLVRCLNRENTELLILVLSFLKKLSIYVENKNEMMQINIIENISHLVPHENSYLLNMSLRLLWNLSFDIELRNEMVKCGFVPKFIHLMSLEPYKSVTLGILYHISMEDRYKSLLTYIDCIPIVVNMIIECDENALPVHLIAFGINLATNKRNAQIMCSKDSLTLLMARAIGSKDPLLMKMLRNVSHHDGTKNEFVDFVGDLCKIVTSNLPKDNDDFIIECIGILGNLSIPEIDFEKVLVQYHLLEYLNAKFSQEDLEDDMLLELIILVGAIAIDESACLMMFESFVMKHILEALSAKQRDDEIVSQIVYVFYRMLCHQGSRKFVMEKTHIPNYLIDLIHDKNKEVRRYCDLALEIISAHSEEWAKKLKKADFQFHNSQWLEMIESQQMEDGDFYVDDTYSPCIQESDILSKSDLLYGSGAYESLLSDGSLSPDILDDKSIL